MTDPIRSRPTPWHNVLLLCGKCARKLDGGFGPDRGQTLRSALRQALKAAGRRREVAIIETRCLGICPKKSVTALSASRPGEIFVIPQGTPADAALARLIGGAASAPPNESAAD